MSASLYDILEISPTASADEVRFAYRLQTRRWHPDRNPGDPVAAERMAQINHAYAILSDPLDRMDYDAARLMEQVPAIHPAPMDRGDAKVPASPDSRDTDEVSRSFAAIVLLLATALVCVVALVAGMMWLLDEEGPPGATKGSSAELHKLREFVESGGER